ncbi:MAG: helix-turn-helix transcriptional regulator [Chthoniobacterales bacterium]
MKRSIVREIGRSQRLSILELLKCSAEGLSVKDLSAQLSMSYMGVKAHCLSMHRQGYLETWRQPGGRGRPLMYYRLTQKAYELFSEENNTLSLSLLQAARALFGATAPQKLLMLHFRNTATQLKTEIEGTTAEERARSFAKLRDREGRFTRFEDGPSWNIVESHNPLQSILKLYPEVDALECNMISEVIGFPIHREVSQVAGIYRSIIQPKK